jgi:tubulinyl-Tyr carboxypeptidase
MIHEEEIKLQIDLIRSTPSLPSPPPSPRVPNLQGVTSIRQRVEIIQRFITSFQYNYTGQPFVKMIKSRGMSHISSCAKEMIRLGLPIQCMEAVFLGCYLTAEFSGLDRLPLSFKSKCESNTHRHIVLALRYENKWGAIGISRRSTLMSKDLTFPSLCDLIQEYKASYASCGHRLIKIYIGLPFSHDIHCDMSVLWRVFKHTTYDCDLEELRAQLDSFSANMLKTFEFFRREGFLPSKNKKRDGVPSQRREGQKRNQSVPPRLQKRRTDSSDEGGTRPPPAPAPPRVEGGRRENSTGAETVRERRSRGRSKNGDNRDERGEQRPSRSLARGTPTQGALTDRKSEMEKESALRQSFFKDDGDEALLARRTR